MTSVISKLPVLILYPHGRCNCRCVMCDIWKSADAREITAEELRRHIADIERLGVEWVVLSGGEPLMHSDLFRLCSMLRPMGIRITLLSSGILLERYAEKIATHIDDVIVSLDGPREIHDMIRRVRGAYGKLEAGVRKIRSFDPTFAIRARCTVQQLNCAHLVETVAAAREIGLGGLSFLAADVTSTAFNRAVLWSLERQTSVSLTLDHLPILEREIESLVSAGECGKFVAESAVKLHRIMERFRAQLGTGEPAAPICNAPWISAVIEADGTIRPCFFQPAIGTLEGGASLADVLNSPRALAFRESLDVPSNPICQRCVCSLNWKRSEK